MRRLAAGLLLLCLGTARLAQAAAPDETDRLIQARQCFPAALQLARDVADRPDDASLRRFCALVTGPCDGTAGSFTADTGLAWQSCLARARDVMDRLLTAPADEVCEERGQLEATMAAIAAHAEERYDTVRPDPRSTIAMAETLALAMPSDADRALCPASPAARTSARMRTSVLTMLDDAHAALQRQPPSPERDADLLDAARLHGQLTLNVEPLAAVERRAVAGHDPELAAEAGAARAVLMPAGADSFQVAMAAALRADQLGDADLAATALATAAHGLDARVQAGETGLRPQAILAYRSALTALDRERARLLDYDWIRLRSPYRQRAVPLVDRYVALQLDEAASLPEAERGPIYRAVMRVSDLARAVELSDYFRDDCVAELEAQSRAVGAIDPKAAALITIVRDRVMELFLALPDGSIRHHSAPLPPAAELEAYPASLIDSTDPDGWKARARELYDLMIRPFAGDLAASGADTLVFVPDGVLRNVLPGTLLDGDVPLIERYAIAVNPGLDFVDTARAPRGRMQWLLGAVTRACPPRWDALAGTEREVDEIAAVGGRRASTVRVDDGFDQAQLFNDIGTRTVTVVHLATHATFMPEASDSRVLMGNCEELDLDGLERLVKQAKFRERPVELLVLSACQSALGDDRAALGLAGLAVKSGARAAIGSMWRVDDAAAERLMTLFHARLAKGDVSKAQALRDAQLTLRTEPGFAAPAFWAAFQLVGDWR